VGANLPDPGGRCSTSPGEPCGNTGLCDGAGACQKAGPQVQCSAGSCTGSTLTPPGTCNGRGSCTTGATTSCAPYTCDTDGTCRASCTLPEHCLAPAMCRKGKNVCRAPGAPE
jgi:hypothetical protein